MNNGELPLKDSQKKAFFVSGAFHAAFFLFLVMQGLFAPQTERASKKLLVQSIALKPHLSEKSSPKRIEAPPGPPAPPEPAPALEVAASEPQESVEAPVDVPEPAIEAAPAKKEEKTSQKQSSPAPEPSPAPSPKQKAAPKQTASKKAAPSSPQKGKTTSKPAGKAVSSKKQATSKKPSGPSYNARLIAEAIDRLNKSHKAAESGKGGGGGGGSGKVSRVGSIGALHSDIGVSTQEGSDDEGQEFSETSAEGCYIVDLIRRLQLNIRLAEPGEIRLKLKLKKNGQVDSITVVSCKNEKIKRSLLEKLKTIHFSPFGQSFPGEAEHTFLLKLSNDLLWSSDSR